MLQMMDFSTVFGPLAQGSEEEWGTIDMRMPYQLKEAVSWEFNITILEKP